MRPRLSPARATSRMNSAARRFMTRPTAASSARSESGWIFGPSAEASGSDFLESTVHLVYALTLVFFGRCVPSFKSLKAVFADAKAYLFEDDIQKSYRRFIMCDFAHSFIHRNSEIVENDHEQRNNG